MSNQTQSSRYSFLQRLFHFLGSMELAITLLLTLAVASVIGTVLQQNQPYTDYLIKFGPFWFEIFEVAGLYDVYSALWFLLILALLVISTSVCVIRHTPSMLKDIVSLRTHVQEKSLRAMRHQSQWLVTQSVDHASTAVEQSLNSQGFRTRVTPLQNNVLISAMRGGVNRLGYIFTHVAIVVICIGGLMDSNLPLKLAEWRGTLKVETSDVPLSQVPQESRLQAGPQAFRGSVNIPEGNSADVAFIGVRDGYVVQHLPFSLEVKDFRIEHYANGQPKSFETDLLVHDKDLDAPLASTISVNHPLIYKGYAVYQASFSDGGSILDLQAWPLESLAGNKPVSLQTKVFSQQQMRWGNKQLRLEMSSFRPFNINPDPTEDEPDRVRNFGPSFGFKLRSSTGEATEYVNYMSPVERDGRLFYLSGVRNSPAEEFAYLYLPADDEGELDGFMAFFSRLHDSELISKIADAMVNDTMASLESDDLALRQTLQQTLEKLVQMFVDGGFDEVRRFVETGLPEADRDSLGAAYLAMMREMLARLYFANQQDSASVQTLFLQDAIDAIGSLPRYGSPVFLQLTDYEHIEASGLQIAHAPGKPVVYFGCALLTMGVFLLFYVPQRRFWVLLSPRAGGVEVVLAGTSNRNPRDFDLYYQQFSAALQKQMGNSI